MSVKSQLCNIIIDTKDEKNLTYDEILSLCSGGLHRSQLSNILKYEGLNVSIDTIEFVLLKLGVIFEIQTRN